MTNQEAGAALPIVERLRRSHGTGDLHLEAADTIEELVKHCEASLDLIDSLYRKYGVELDAADTAIAQAARRALLAKLEGGAPVKPPEFPPGFDKPYPPGGGRVA